MDTASCTISRTNLRKYRREFTSNHGAIPVWVGGRYLVTWVRRFPHGRTS